MDLFKALNGIGIITMIREIKFRGVCKLTGKMVAGNLIQSKEFKDGRRACWIQPRSFLALGAVSTPTTDFISVLEETTGQYTGLKDKDDVEIYKDDILQDGDNRLYRVEFITGCFCLKDKWGSTKPLYETNDDCKRIGNIHENPELLK